MVEKTDKNILKMEECGCRRDIIDVYTKTDEKENKVGMIQTFDKYRQELQGEIDEDCKSIDNIDYLIYKIEKRNEGGIHDY